MSDHENTQQVFDDHAADAAAHHPEKSAGTNLSEDADGTLNVEQGDGSGLDADSVDGQEPPFGNHIEAKSGGGNTDVYTFTWTTAFSSTPVVTANTLDEGSSHTNIDVESKSTTSADIRSVYDNGDGSWYNSNTTKEVMAMEET
jgi:hypothetical protein